MRIPPEGNRNSRPDAPRRIRNGIRLRRKEGHENWSWPAEDWAKLLLDSIDSKTLNKALEYGRTGQAARFEITPGCIVSLVQCLSPKPHEVRIEFPAFAEVVWKRVLHLSAVEAIYAAKLLAGEFPKIVAEPFEAAGHPLVPTIEEIRATCCCGAKQPCVHVVLVSLILLERIEETPEIALELRGRGGERFRSDLQEERMLATRGISQAHTNPDIVRLAGPIRSVESRLHEFWGPGASLEESRNSPLPKHVPHALLRRLGASPLEGRFPITGLLASIYDTVAEETRRIVAEAENPDEQANPEADINQDQSPSGRSGAPPYSSS